MNQPMRGMWLALLGAVLCGSALAASPPSPLPAEAFFKPAAIQDVALSPSGKRMALTVPAVGGRVGLFVVELQGSEFKGTRAAQFSDGDVSRFQWVDDERLVFTSTDLQAGLGEDYRQAPGLYAVRFDGQEMNHLVEVRGRPFLSNGERVRTLPWNHMLLHVPAPSEERGAGRADEVIVGEMHFSGNDLISITPLWLNTRTARTRTLAMEYPTCNAQRWWFSAQGEPRAVLCRTDGRESIHWYHAARDGAPGQWKPIAEGPLYQLGLWPLWVGQGESLYVSHRAGKAGEREVAPYDFKLNRPGETLVTAPGFDFNGTLLGDRQGQRLLGVRIHTDAEQTLWLDAAFKAAQARVDAALPGRVNRMECRRCGSGDAVILVRSYSDLDPGQLLLFRESDNDGKGRWMRVGRVRAEIVPEQMAATVMQRIRARDGRDLPVWVTRPAGAKQPLPAVVLVHGGPWTRGRYWNWQELPQFLASRGYVVIEPEFRGSEGYGLAHLRAGFKQWGQAMQDDVADALLWAQKERWASDAACIIGGSYGGYSTLMGLIRHPELYRCGSAWVAVTDPFLYLSGSWWVSDDISDAGRRYSLPVTVGDAEKDREMLLANSPLAQAARITKPLQLVWGREDRRVPIAHGNRLREAMQKAGREPEWVVYDDEAHGWRKTEHRLDFALKLEAFLARHLGPAAAGR